MATLQFTDCTNPVILLRPSSISLFAVDRRHWRTSQALSETQLSGDMLYVKSMRKNNAKMVSEQGAIIYVSTPNMGFKWRPAVYKTLSATLKSVNQRTNDYVGKTKDSSDKALKKYKQDSFYIDKRGKLRNFNHKKVSRKKCGSLRGRGWKYGSGFVDGIFPVLSPTAQKILDYVQMEVNTEKVCKALDMLPASLSTWDDIFNVAVHLRMKKKWDSIILICRWILYGSSFKPDVICYNLLIDAFGQKFLYKEAESTYLHLLNTRCVPSEDTYALLIKAYCMSKMLGNAEAVFTEMQNYGVPSSAIVYNAYIDGLIKGGNSQKAEEIFIRMKRNGCKPSTKTYTLLINLYGKANKSSMALKVFQEMRIHKCKPNICTYTALINAFAREGLCEKAEEVFEQMQEAGVEPDVYTYNALMEAYRKLRFLFSVTT